MISYLFTDGASFAEGLDAMTCNVLSGPPALGRSKVWTAGYDAGYRAAVSEAGAIARTVHFPDGPALAVAFDAVAARVKDSGAAIAAVPGPRSLKALEGWHAGFSAGLENAAYVARAAEFQTTDRRI